MTRILAAAALATWCSTPALGQVVPSQAINLTQAITLALAQEPSTRAARAEVEVARGMSVQAGLRANPTISAEHRGEPGGSDNATDIGVEWPLELFRRGPRLSVANADVTVAEHQESELRRQLTADVSMAYGDAAAALRQLNITGQVLSTATEQLELLRARVTQGVTPPLDRDMLDVEVRRIQAERLIQSGRAERALVRLKRLLGMAPDALLTLTQSLEDLATASAGAEVSLASRPDVLASEARVRAEEQRLVAARADSRPEVTIFGSFMRMSSTFPQRGFAPDGALEPVSGRFHYLSGGVMFTVPLWNKQQGTVAATLAAREAAQARLEAIRLTAAAEEADARLRLAQALAAVSLYDSGVRPLARRNLDTVRETYGLGRATVLDTLAEQRRYLDTERAYTEALVEVFASRVSLTRATGSGR